MKGRALGFSELQLHIIKGVNIINNDDQTLYHLSVLSCLWWVLIQCSACYLVCYLGYGKIKNSRRGESVDQKAKENASLTVFRKIVYIYPALSATQYDSCSQIISLSIRIRITSICQSLAIISIAFDKS